MPDNQIKKEQFSVPRGSLTIRGMYFRPEGKNMPVAVISHGMMANYDSTEKYAEWFAEHGFASVCFDFCGGGPSSRSSGKTSDMTVFTETEDLKAVINHASSLPETDGSRIILMGCSQGGVVSALAAADLRDNISGLVLFYPAFSITDCAREGKMLMAEFDPENIPETFQCGPMTLGREYASSVRDADLLGMAGGYGKKVLIVHGTSDDIVDCAYSKRACAAYKNAELKLIPGARHGFSGAEDETALRYVEEYISSL